MEAGEESASRPPGPSSLALWTRCATLRLVELGFHGGNSMVVLCRFLLGGFAPLLRDWTDDQIKDWGEAVDALGGLRLRSGRVRADTELGPVLQRFDAPELFRLIEQVARRLGVRAPEQVRLSYLPCCGVIELRGARAVLIGLPLLQIFTVAELRAALAHELAHLAKGDMRRSARAARFVNALARALERSDHPRFTISRLWARFCLGLATRLAAPVAHGQEYRADRVSANLAGGVDAASALVKVALVQPLFREVLSHYESIALDSEENATNVYAHFHAFWNRLPEGLLSRMRLTLLAQPRATTQFDSTHPPLHDRFARLTSYPDAPAFLDGERPASSLLCDLSAQEERLHDQLFGLNRLEPSVYHRAGR